MPLDLVFYNILSQVTSVSNALLVSKKFKSTQARHLIDFYTQFLFGAGRTETNRVMDIFRKNRIIDTPENLIIIN